MKRLYSIFWTCSFVCALISTGFAADDLTLKHRTVEDGQTASYYASNSLSAGPAYVIQDGGDVKLISGNDIILYSGFVIEPGGDFEAIISACDLTDTQDPVFSGGPGDIEVTLNQGETDTVVTWTPPTVTDNVGVVYFEQSAFLPGDTFSAGDTNISYLAEDCAGNVAVYGFTITVIPYDDGSNPDSDGDGLPDSWEYLYFGGINSQGAGNDPDGDDLTNLEEYQLGTIPTEPQPPDPDPASCGDDSQDPATYYDADLVLENGTLYSGQSMTKYVTNNITLGPSYVIESGAILHVTSGNDIILRSGLDLQPGAALNMVVSDCNTNDTTPPVISGTPDDMYMTVQVGVTSATVTWTPPTATDNDQVVDFSGTHVPGTDFPLGTTTVTYTASDCAGNVADCSFDVTVAGYPGPSINVSATPQTILYGEPTDLTWTTTYASTVTIEQGIGDVNPNGVIRVSPSETTTYQFTATGAAGTATGSITVNVVHPYHPPTATISADPIKIISGNSTTLSWYTENADTVTIEPDIGVMPPVPPGGTTNVYPTTHTTYTILAENLGGTPDSADVTVEVYPQPTVSITADPDFISPGDTTHLCWDSTNADTVTIDQGIGAVNPTGCIDVTPLKTTTYTITASCPAEPPVKATVTVMAPRTLNVPSAYYATIQDAINDAENGDEVLVDDGTYSGPGNVNIDFMGKEILVWSANGPENTVIDCQGEGRGFHFHHEEGSLSILDGFTITGGSVGSPDGGGGLFIQGASPSIENCIITGNDAFKGGGLHIEGPAAPSFTNCMIVGNTANYAGGVYIWGAGADPVFTNCTISNTTTNGDHEILGFGQSDTVLKYCIVWGNTDESILYSTDNSLVTATYSNIKGGFTGVGNVDKNPHFVGSGDYHLTEYSYYCQILDTVITDAPNMDIDGDARPYGDWIEMGADEFMGDFIIPREITATVDGNGTITPSGLTTVADGDSLTYVMTPDPNNAIYDVLVDNLSVGAVSTYIFNYITADHTIHVVFKQLFTITATATTGGNIDPSGAVSVAEGSSQVFTITPSSGYLISDVLVDNVSVGAVDTHTFNNISADHTIHAVFEVITCTIPDVVGMTQASAESTIVSANLSVGSVTPQYSSTVPQGDVVSQNPAAGTTVPQGSTVDLVVSLGPAPVSVPDVVGMTEADAQAAILAANLSVGSVTPQYSSTVPQDNVISQNPAGGTPVAAGSSVDLVVSLGPGGSGCDGDSDCDGVSDYIEGILQTDPNNPDEYPAPGAYYEYDELGRIKRVIRIQ